MKQFFMALLLACSSHYSFADNVFTRGIGRYPGRVSQFTAPCMVKDYDYRNIALNRMVFTSSNADFNLTGQLITDGLVTKNEPAFLSVRTNGGEVSGRDREKLIDGNIHSSQVLKGENAFIEYNWSGMDVYLDTLRFVGEMAYHETKAVNGYAIRVMVSADGRKWQQMGVVKGSDLPGFASKQFVSSDPNKQLDAVRLPLRMVKMQIPLKKAGRYKHVRVEFNVKGAAWWRLYEIDHGALLPNQERFSMDNLRWKENNTSWLPSMHFSSVWKSAKSNEPQWAYVDLGTEADIDKVVLNWLQKPKAGKIQVSSDAKKWEDLAQLKASNINNVKCNTHGRYVRLLLTQPNASGYYALSEMQVWGRGGIHAESANTLDGSNGKLMLNQWQLRRDGSEGWIEATVPGTVLTSYMNIGAVPDNCYANNMREISESFFNSDFWYRTIINHQLSVNRGKHIYLNFDGINWKAEVWLNNEMIGRIDGAFMRGRFDITDKLKEGENQLQVRVIKNEHIGAVKIKTAQNTDTNGGILGADNPTFHASIGWDWITSVPGREVGIWNDVYLTEDGGVSVSDPLITTQLNHPDTLATITPSVMVKNQDAIAKKVKVMGFVGDIRFEKWIELKAMEGKEITFSPADFAQLKNQNMRLWWPNGYGEPYLYDAGFEVYNEHNECLSQVTYKAGIREMSYKDLDSRTTLYINGKRLNPLGGNWGFSETNLNYRGREYDAAVRYHKEMNNTMIRNWVGQIGDEEFYEACDKYGIMVWQDFWLANPWDGPNPYYEDMFLRNSADYISRIRNHPSIAIYVGRNEGFPPTTIDKVLREQIKGLHPQLGYIPSSADMGVSGHGPYRMMSAEYYFSHQTHLLHSERGMPNVPNIESIKRMLKPENLWPQGEAWGQHDFTLQGAQRGESFNEIMKRHFGEPKSAEQFATWAQWLNYDGYRAMYESAEQDRMGLLIWMSHSCWPSMVWCTYDYYLDPTAAYFGVKKACEPLHIQYNAAKKTVEVVNYVDKAHASLQAKAQLLNMWGKVIDEHSAGVSIKNDETLQVMSLSKPNEDVYYIRLALIENGKTVSENFYVEGCEADNLQALKQLPKAEIKMEQSDFVLSGEEYKGTIKVSNVGSSPALMIRISVKGTDGEQILPIIYSDNYFSLMPGESKTVNVSYRKEDSRGVKPRAVVYPFELQQH